jgi:hypothetical protein
LSVFTSNPTIDIAVLFKTRDLSLVKRLVLLVIFRIHSGAVPLGQLTLFRAVRPSKTYKSPAHVPPQGRVADRLALLDPRAVPREKQRIGYVVVAGAGPGARLGDMVRCPREVLSAVLAAATVGPGSRVGLRDQGGGGAGGGGRVGPLPLHATTSALSSSLSSASSSAQVAPTTTPRGVSIAERIMKMAGDAPATGGGGGGVGPPVQPSAAAAAAAGRGSGSVPSSIPGVATVTANNGGSNEHELVRVPRINARYYVTKQIVPALMRALGPCGGDVEAWVREGWASAGSYSTETAAAASRPAAMMSPSRIMRNVLADAQARADAALAAATATAAAAASASGGGQHRGARRPRRGRKRRVDPAPTLHDLPSTTLPETPGPGTVSLLAPRNLGGLDLSINMRLPRHRPSGGAGARLTMTQHFPSQRCAVCATLTPRGRGFCTQCEARKPRTGAALLWHIAAVERRQQRLHDVCVSECHAGRPVAAIECDSLECPVFYERVRAAEVAGAARSFLRRCDEW